MCKCGEFPNGCRCGQDKPKLDLSKPVQTKNGKRVRILCTNRKGGCPVVGLITNNDGNEEFSSWDISGKWADIPSKIDLVNVPETLKKTAYLFKGDYGHYISNSNFTKGEVASVEVEFTVGKFVDEPNH